MSTGRIASVRTSIIDVPLRRPPKFSVLEIDHQSLVLVRVRTDDEIVAEASSKLDTGQHASFKLKMGSQDPDSDVRRIEKVAAALAGRASLRVDLNASWDELTATRYLPRLQDAGITLAEQPLPAWDTEWHGPALPAA